MRHRRLSADPCRTGEIAATQPQIRVILNADPAASTVEFSGSVGLAIGARGIGQGFGHAVAIADGIVCVTG